jgi:hypothetical protein
MRRSAILFALALTAACGPPHGGESPVSGGSPPTSGVVVVSAVHGIVVDAAGKPAPGIMVAARSLDEPPRAVPELAVVSDAEGRFEWPLQPGRYRLEIMAAEGAAAKEVEVTGGPGLTVELVLR